jgi:hypothetical protein
VLVRGDNLAGGTVYLNGKPQPTEACTPTDGPDRDRPALCFTTPPFPTGSKDSLVATVTVRTPNGKTSNAAAFRYLATTPRIANIEPSQGPDVGGSRVLVRGDNLAGGTVYLNGKPQPTEACTPTDGPDRDRPALCFTTPPFPTGSKDSLVATVTVRTPNGKTSNVAAFRYLATRPRAG